MIRKSGNRFSEKIMRKQKVGSMIRKSGNRFSEKIHAQAKKLGGQSPAAGSLLLIAVRALPAARGNIENDAVGVLELALEIAVTFVAQVEEEFAAVVLDALLRLGDIVDLKAEM